jgi:uncharacterized RDD family membrane protein YckC
MEEKYPLLIERIQSAFVDAVFVIVLMFVFANILDGFNDVPDWVRVLLFVLLFIAYEPLCMTLGCTMGNYIKGIRVRKSFDTTKRINFPQAIVRYMIKLLLGWISFVTIHSNPKRKAIHDLAIGSVMIKYPT